MAVGRAAFSDSSDKSAEGKTAGKAAAQPAAVPAAAAQPAAATQSVTVLDFDVPADALKAKDPELSLLLRKAGELALKYSVPVVLVSNSADRDYLMHELMQAGEPAILYRLGEYPRISISRTVPAGSGEVR